jgi:hypothetical protein
MDEKYKNYVYDLGILLKEMGEKAAEEHRLAKGTRDENYKLVYLMGFHRVLTLMQLQAEDFDIPQDELGMKGFDADFDLI